MAKMQHSKTQPHVLFIIPGEAEGSSMVFARRRGAIAPENRNRGRVLLPPIKNLVLSARIRGGSNACNDPPLSS